MPSLPSQFGSSLIFQRQSAKSNSTISYPRLIAPHPLTVGTTLYVFALSELGLRTSEVAGVRLDDIDWREGTLTVSSTKTRRFIILPLPKRLGQAIVDYICNGRPKSTDRHIFLRHVAPKSSPIARHIVQNAVQRACSRASLEWCHISPHAFRHTIASRMHEKGATFKEIADVLGHQQIDTVSIYAKVNLRQLSEVALPWPEVLS